jgi:tetratricopeptide (TPR) repeat protein
MSLARFTWIWVSLSLALLLPLFAVPRTAEAVENTPEAAADKSPEPPADYYNEPVADDYSEPDDSETVADAESEKPAELGSEKSSEADKSSEKTAQKKTDKATETADSPGQADLDRAVQIRLDADGPAELGEVISLCQRALDKGLDDGNDEFARKLLASTLIQRGKMMAGAIFAPPRPDPRWPQLRQLAVADLERALKHVPDQPEAYLLLGRLQSLPGGDRNAAVVALTEAIRLSDEEPKMQFEALILHVGLDENPEHRLADLNKAVELEPSNPVPWRMRGSLKLSGGKPEAAVADFDVALKLDPKHAATYEVRGLALTMLKRLDEARESYGHAVELAPKSPALLLQHAQVSYLSEKFADAASDATQVLRIDSENGAALLLRSQALARLGKNDEALADIESLLKLRPDLPPALRARAVIESSLGKTDEAIADLEKVCQQEPEDLECRFQLALLYRTKKNLAKAFETFDSALAIDPKSWFLRYGRADLYLSVGKHIEALKDYEIAYELQPEEPGLLNNFAWLLATSPDDKVRNGRRAIKLATKANELTDNKAPHILSTLAAAYAESGDFEAARTWSKKSVELATKENREQLRKELASYEGSQAWRELLHEDQGESVIPNTADKSAKQDSDEAASALKNPRR